VPFSHEISAGGKKVNEGEPLASRTSQNGEQGGVRSVAGFRRKSQGKADGKRVRTRIRKRKTQRANKKIRKQGKTT